MSSAYTVDLVLPVYNEEVALPTAVAALLEEMAEPIAQGRCRIIISDNASTDDTRALGEELAAANPGVVELFHIPLKGRGRAVREAWLHSKADVRAYMDVDLSTDLAALPALIDAVGLRGYDLAVGSRLSPGSRVIDRSLRREVMSRGWNLLVRGLYQTDIPDADCGFKAISARLAEALLPRLESHGWFFDAELILCTEHNGFPIQVVPVQWTDDPDTRVNVPSTIWEELSGLVKLRFDRERRKI